MKPAPFEYTAPETLGEAISLLQQRADDDVKILAGGQSLMPLLNMRMARPELLIDLKLSQEEWGDLVGTTRESVNKQFRSWAGEGLIALEKGRVVILDIDELEKLADCVVL